MGAATLGATAQSFTGSVSSYPTSGTFTETIPAGAVQAVIEVTAGTGQGGARFVVGCNTWGGGGGGSGSYAKKTLNVAGQGGKTLSVVIGAAGVASSISSGTLAITTITTNPGANGGNASNGSGGALGSGGAAGTGGDTNTGGNNGTAGSNVGPGSGGTGVVGTNLTGNPGGQGAYATATPGAGQTGNAKVTYS